MNVGSATQANKLMSILGGAQASAARPAAKKADHDADDAAPAKPTPPLATSGPGQIVDRKV